MFCNQCGSEISKNSKFCNKCGTNIEENNIKEKVENNPRTSFKKENKKSRNSRNRGIWWIVSPFLSLVIVLVLWAIASFVISSIGDTGDSAVIVGRIINVALGFIGVLCVIFIPIGIVVGARLLNINDDPEKYDERSGNGENSVFPEELKKWNWGAAGLGIIWGAYYRVWISFIAFIPFVNIFWWIIMGIYGNRWAWEKNKWESVEKFKEAQSKWNIWGVVCFFLSLILGFFGAIGSISQNNQPVSSSSSSVSGYSQPLDNTVPTLNNSSGNTDLNSILNTSN